MRRNVSRKRLLKRKSTCIYYDLCLHRVYNSEYDYLFLDISNIICHLI